MLPLIYTDPTATLLFVFACLVWIIPETVGMFRQRARVGLETISGQDRGSLIVVVVLQWLGLTLNFLLGWLDPAAAISGPQQVLFLLGVACIFLGVGLRWYAIWTLGGYFTRDVSVSEQQGVVERGPYRWIRHPAYSGTFLTMLGVGLALTNWASLISLLACVLLGHFYRVWVEEQALAGVLGEPYVEYMRRTKRFIPFVF